MSGRQAYREGYYGDRLRDAYLFQDFVMWQLAQRGFTLQCYQSKEAQQACGESIQGVELKHARRLSSYSAIYIEIDERSDPAGEFFASGIYAQRPVGTPEPEYGWLYGIGDYKEFYLFRLMRLLALHHSGRFQVVDGHGESAGQKVCMGHGFLLPKDIAKREASRYYRWDKFPPWVEGMSSSEDCGVVQR